MSDDFEPYEVEECNECGDSVEPEQLVNDVCPACRRLSGEDDDE